MGPENETAPTLPPGMPLGPVPTSVTLGHVTGENDVKIGVTIMFATPQGLACFFLAPDEAKAIGNELAAHGDACSALEIPDAAIRRGLGMR